MLSRCPKCKKDFPEHLINPMYIACPLDDSGEHLMCPLCALKVRNNLHGVPEDTPFRGTIANKHWEEATEYARKRY